MSNLKLTTGVAGYFKLVATNVNTGKVRDLTGWFKNLITDAGLERIGAASQTRQYCMVGSGSTPPTISDTALQSPVANTLTQQGNSSGLQTSSPYYSWNRYTYRFAAGAAAGNLTEVGVGWTSSLVFSRSLIKDSGGNPISVTVLSDEILDVQYEMRVYAPETDSNFQLVIGGVTHDCVLRAWNVTTSTHWRGWDAISVPQLNININNDPIVHAYTGALGAITANPSGTSTAAGSVSRNAYSANSKKLTGSINFGLNEGNLAGGIAAVTFGSQAGYLGAFKVSFSPAINKLNTQTLILNIEMSWARAA